MVDLQAQYKSLKNEIDARIIACVESGAYIHGPEVKALETGLGKYLDDTHVVACANGTDALQIALMALNLESGDEVIVPSFTFVAIRKSEITIWGGFKSLVNSFGVKTK